MTNVISPDLFVRTYAGALAYLRKQMPFLQFCLRMDDMIHVPAMPNAVITIPIPSRMGDAEDVVPGPAPYQGEPILPTNVDVRINQWVRKGFYLTDSEMNSIANGVMGGQQQAALDSVASTIVKRVLAASYKKAYSFAGTPGTVPFASNYSVAAQARKLMNRAGVPPEQRYIFLDADADANAIQLPQYTEFQKAGPDAIQTLMMGEIGMKAGFRWFSNMYLELAARHVNGTAAPGAYVVNGAGQAATPLADTGVLAVTTGTGAPNEGTLFTIAGDTQQYVCNAGCTTTTWNISPGLQKSPAASAVITIIGPALATDGYLQSLAMHRDAIAFASRGDGSVLTEQMSKQIMEIPDPMSGIVLCMELTRQNKQTMIEFSVQFGHAVARRECLVRLPGAFG